MLEPILKAAGLDPKEAQVYEEIVRSGKTTVVSLLDKISVKRGDLYNVLRRLEGQKLIHALPEIKKLTYVASDPEAVERGTNTMH